MANSWFDSIPGPRLTQFIAEKGDAVMERYHTDDVYFAIWMHSVNRAVQRRIFLSFDDLEDWDYWSAYDSDMSPKQAAVQMLEDNGYSDAYDEALS